MNYLYLGDCLNVLRDSVEDESVDLIYIDPPFNSKRDYNIFFDNKEIQTQRVAFDDTWTLKSIQDSLGELHNLRTDKIYKLLTTYQEVAPHAFPYLVMMSLRILELHRVLKPTGSFYLHCDPTMSHYLKTVCDLIFEVKNYRNEIIWKRTNNPKGSQFKDRKYGVFTDTLLYYSKSDQYIFELERVRTPLTETEIIEKYPKEDERGKYLEYPIIRSEVKGERPNLVYEYKGYTPPRWGWVIRREKLIEIDNRGDLGWRKNGSPFRKYRSWEDRGKAVGNLWDDIIRLQSNSKEDLGYPTQKPKALLERIIKASSNEGDTVLDAFCGCGTTVDAAEGLHRKWVGIDISPIALSLIKRRLIDTYKTSLSKYEVRGTPADEKSAIKLWEENEFAFQDWWLTELEVFSTTEGTRGPDKGIDGIGQYLIDKSEKTIRVAFQVKGGKVAPKDIDALIGTLTKHKCELGVFLTIHVPTKAMHESATSAGFLELPNYQFPKIQILTLKDFFNNQKPKLPPTNITFRAAKFKGKKVQQIDLGL